MGNVQIVPYQSKYRDMVRDCVYVSGFGGDSLEPFFESRELYADIRTLYYTECEPESSYIALIGEKPVGLLLGSVDTQMCARSVSSTVIPKILGKLLRGKYTIGPAARKYLLNVFLQSFRGEYTATPVEIFPAHFHIDIYKDFRRIGAGSLLIRTYIDYLRKLGVSGVHLLTSSFHDGAVLFYGKLGFRRYSHCRLTTSYFGEVSDKQYYQICYVKNLNIH